MLSINIKDDKNTIRSSSVKEKPLNSHLRTPAFQSCFLLNMCTWRCPSRLYFLVSIRVNFFNQFLIYQRHICTTKIYTSLVMANNKRAFNDRPGKHPGSGLQGSAGWAAASAGEGGRHPAGARLRQEQQGCASTEQTLPRGKPSCCWGRAVPPITLFHTAVRTRAHCAVTEMMMNLTLYFSCALAPAKSGINHGFLTSSAFSSHSLSPPVWTLFLKSA